MEEVKTNIEEAQSPAIETLQQKPKKCGWINEFLWSCAGVNKKVLRQCASDYAKYAGIGGTILFTAIMAALSGGYAMYFVFNDEPIGGEQISDVVLQSHNNYATWIAIAFGIFLGLLIFNLDRFMVNTMYSDGKHTISKQELKSGAPRILMAIFLGLVISTPLEMKIFSDQITAQVAIDNGLRGKKAREAYQYLYDDLKKYEDQKKVIENETAKLRQEYLNAEQDKKIEIEGKAASGKEGKGPVYQEKANLAEVKKAEYENYDASKALELETLNNDIAQTKKNIKIQEEQNKKDVTNNGFAVRYQAFQKVEYGDWHLALASWMITLLFVIIETAPTFFKMMMQDGAYDNLLNAEKHRVKVLSQQKISDVNDFVNTEVKISTMKNQKRLEAEMLANEEILKKLATVQAELLNKSIDAWREEELRKIEEDPKSYLQIKLKPDNNKK